MEDIWAEVNYTGLHRDAKNCEKCGERFRCWTSNGFIIKPERLALERGIDIDRLRLEAYVPSCFLCGNMIGAEIIIHNGREFDTFEGKVTEQHIAVMENTPIWIELIAVHKCRF